MLLYIKHKKHRLPWHIAVGTLPLPVSAYSTRSDYQRYATNTFCGHRVFGFVYEGQEDIYGSHDVSEILPQHQIELCQKCVKFFQHRTGQAFDFVQLQGIQMPMDV